MLFAMSSEEYLMVESIILRWCFITPIGRCEWMSRMSIVEICAYSARTTAEGNVLSATPCRYCCPSSDHLQQPSAVSVPPPFVQSSVPVQVPQQAYYRAPVQVCVNQSQSIGNYPNPIYPPSQPGLSSHTVHYTYQVPSNTGSVWSPYRS